MSCVVLGIPKKKKKRKNNSYPHKIYNLVGRTGMNQYDKNRTKVATVCERENTQTFDPIRKASLNDGTLIKIRIKGIGSFQTKLIVMSI